MTLRPTIILIDGPIPAGASVAVIRAARLQALIAAIDHLAADMDDDGETAIVVSERLQRVLGFARRDKRDLAEGNI